MGPGDQAQRVADVALAKRAAHLFGQELGPGPERRQHIVEHGLEDRGNAGHDMHIADDEARRAGDRIVDVAAAHGHARHALAGGRELQAALGVMRAEQRQRVRIVIAGDAEGGGHRVGGDVVMGGADAAGGKDIVVAGAERVERLDDPLLVVGDDADFLERDAGGGEHFGEMADVLVLGAAREQFVADRQRGCGHGQGVGLAHGHVLPGSCPDGIGRAPGQNG